MVAHEPSSFDEDSECLAWLSKWPTVESAHRKLVSELRRGEAQGSRMCALKTVAVARSMVGSCKWRTALELLGRLRWLGTSLQRAAPFEYSVGNVIRRIMLIVREEYATLADSKGPEGPSLGDVLRGGDDDDEVAMDLPFGPELLHNIMEQIVELYGDVQNAVESLASQARQHVNENDVVLTVGNSDDVLAFLRMVPKAEIIVVETSPGLGGHDFARRLGGNVAVVPESSAFALMSRVHKVILPAHAVLADGSLLTPASAFLAALAAKHASVQVLCLASLYQLCPTYAHDPEKFDHLASPNDVLPYSLLPSTYDNDTPIFVKNPRLDLLPPHLVDLYITSAGVAHRPNYVYRLLNELYSHRDHHLFLL